MVFCLTRQHLNETTHTSGHVRPLSDSAVGMREEVLMQDENRDFSNDDVVALGSFDAAVRRAALERLYEAEKDTLPAAGAHLNCHAHTFYSYNAYGYSPSRFAWLAKQRGLAAGGIVDFDVLDGLDEFLAAASLLKLKGCVSVESRVFVPEFADRSLMKALPVKLLAVGPAKLVTI